MTGLDGKAIVAAALLCGALALGLPSAPAMAAADDQAVEAGAADDGPATLRDAVQLMARHFDFTVIGANRLGTDAPSWPAEELPAEAMLGSLLKDYSYIVLLKPETKPGAPREPGSLLIVGLNHAPAETPASASKPMPVMASADGGAAPRSASHTPSWAPRPSTVVRALTKLASTNSAQPDANGGGQVAQPTAPLPNPAENSAAMAALTHSAQAGLGALVTGLRQACPNPKAC